MAAAGRGRAALDIGDPQVCVRFPDDPRFEWHHRVLLAKITEEGTWAAATPELEVEVLDLRQHQ
eukprot:3974651-Lingulodinium_polyedra.AAC.1